MKQSSALVPVVAGFGIMLLLLLAVTAIGVTHIRILSNQLAAIVSERNQKSEFAATMRALHEARYQSLMLASSQRDAFLRDEEIMRFSHMAMDFIQVRDQFLALPLDSGERQLWERIRQDLKIVEGATNQALYLMQSERLDEARHLIQQDLAPRQANMMGEWGRMVAMQRGKNQLALSQARTAGSQAGKLAMALSAAAFLVGIVIAVFVIRRYRGLEKDLFEEKERAQITLQAIGDAVVRFNHARVVSYLNPVAEHLLGFAGGVDAERPIAQTLCLFDRQSRADLTDALVANVLQGASATLPATACLRTAQGTEYEVEGKCSPIHSPAGDIMGGVLVIRDVSAARAMYRKLLWQADHDSLTGLINRRAFEERVTRSLAGRTPESPPLSLLFIELNRFAQVNDKAGHAAGDALLKQLAQLMQSRIREHDCLGRLGGAEFGILLIDYHRDAAEDMAHAVLAGISDYHFTWRDQSYQVGASIGLAHIPPHWHTWDECLAAAYAACHKAKRSGHNEIVVHQQ